MTIVRPKFTVFISSTYDDLKGERAEVLRAVLEMGHIPVGMEMFSAADEEQWLIITRQIDQCDYYIVIVAHRYGSMFDGVSYTEREYDYAVSQGIPVLGFIINSDAVWPVEKYERDIAKTEALQAFKIKIMKKPVGFWDSAQQLHGSASIALMKTFTTRPRPGWIRATSAVDPQSIDELARLSAENADLRKQVERLLLTAEGASTGRRDLKELKDSLETTRIHVPWLRDVITPLLGEQLLPTALQTESTALQLTLAIGSRRMGAIRLKELGITLFCHLHPEVSLNEPPNTPSLVPDDVAYAWIGELTVAGVLELSALAMDLAATPSDVFWSLTPQAMALYSRVRRFTSA